MRTGYLRRIIVVAILIVLVVVGVVVFSNSRTKAPEILSEDTFGPRHSVIGKSVQDRDIDTYEYGNGEKKILFVGGVHGGYEWNSVLLAYNFIDYIEANTEIIPENMTVAVIPSLNPDGVYKVTNREGRFEVKDTATTTQVLASGRFNANEVDLNRNFDCKWQPESVWQSKKVSAGKTAFSEPEARALRNYIAVYKPSAVVFWHSKSDAVYASACNEGILPDTLKLMNTYSVASGYKAVKTFDAYVTTGAADDWLASIGIPAITVELATHENIEFAKNLAGARAVMKMFEGI